ncbi:RCC1 and BTB domain-containing protein 2-like [Dermatophagoides pteronyssinus]|uniref:RCC1 and BTB domain-containing protein 2-like n=1 Tax=Dermatophagoides pteronyssinus TaxID=6956 RepID=UPI003F66B3FB
MKKHSFDLSTSRCMKINLKKISIMMIKTVDKIIDIDIFQDVFGSIDKNFIESIISIASLFKYNSKNFLMMTKDSTFAYGHLICRMLSLEYDLFKPRPITSLNNMKIVQVDYGDYFVVILTNDGHVYLASVEDVWNTKKTFKLITVSDNDDRFKMIACGESDFLLLRQDGTVFKSFDSIYDSVNARPKRIEPVEDLRNVKLIACGASHWFALTNREKLYSWGDNEFGQLGHGSQKLVGRPTFLQISSDSINNRIKDIASGSYFSLILLENGQLYSWGKNLADPDEYSDSKNIDTPKLVLSQVERIASIKYSHFALAYSKSSYYVWGKIHEHHWPSFTKLNAQFESFAAVVEKFNPSPFTFGLTSTFYQLDDCKHSLCKPEESIRLLFDNPDNYDVEFIIGKQQQQRIVASKCYLKSVSEYFRKMLSGKWRENDRIMIDSYSYDTYYSYLNMLHCGHLDSIKINTDNIGELMDLAHCYCDEKLLGYCKYFIQNDLNEKTLQIYLPLISKYQLDELNGKLRQIALEKLFPHTRSNYRQKIENSVQDFLQNYIEKQQPSLHSSSESIDSSNKKPKIK